MKTSLAVIAVLLSSCLAAPEVSSSRASLAVAPTWDARVGALAVAVGFGERVVFSRHAVSGDILVNGARVGGATVVSTKTISVRAQSPESVEFDFANGTFAPGTSAGPGITVRLEAAE